MGDPTLDRDGLLHTLRVEELPAGRSASQTITPMAYARTAAEAEPAPASVGALPAISLAEAAITGATDEPVAVGDGHDLHVIGALGEGGMGVVSLARQRSLQREVAVKTVRGGAAAAAATAALLHEAVITGSLEHPSIVPVHALGLDTRSGSPVMVMKRIEGTCWRDLLADAAHPAWAELAPGDDHRLGFHLEVLEQVCNALHFAHRRGIIHRDVKPENVMIGSFGEVYLLDWGIATRRRPRAAAPPAPQLVGTPAYMAPEMITQTECTEQTDVYLAGATLHEILTGRPRHHGGTLRATLDHALESSPHTYGPEVPAELAELCNRATSADPSQRPGSALALRQALREFRRHRSSVTAAQAAIARLDELELLVRRVGPDASVHLRAHKLFAECRFGLLHALREWPENPTALAALTRALALMTEHELERGDAASAEALLAELTERAAPAPALHQRLAALEARQHDQRAEAERLRGLAHDLDPRIGARARALMISGVGVLGVALSAYVLGGSLPAASYDQLAAFKLILVYGGAIAVAGLIFRRKLLANRTGRVLAGLFAMGVALVIAHRALALATGEPVATMLSNDMLLIATSMLAAGIAVQRAFFWFGLGAVANASAIALFPQHALALFSLGGFIAFPAGWLAWRNAVKQAR